MLRLGMKNKDIQFFFNRQERAVNSGRITGIRNGSYGPQIEAASEGVVNAFMASFTRSEIVSPLINTAPVAPLAFDPVSETSLRSFFVENSDGVWRCAVGETYEFECKENFNSSGFGKLLKTIAGFANNRGGYIFFGVKDKPHLFKVCGLQDDRFTDTDQNRFTQIIRTALEPTPHFRITTLNLGDSNVGVVYVEAHKSKPVIAGKTEGELKEGFIYFRYPGETRPICYADLRTILDERDRQRSEAIMPMVQRLIELGPQNAMVANLADGHLEGGERPILIDPKSLEQIKFIREGEFKEVNGAPTLRVIGDAQTVPSEMLSPVRTVRQEVTVDSILRNFFERRSVEQPLSYFNQASHEQVYILPIFYYLSLAQMTRRGAINSLESSLHAKPQTRQKFIDLLRGKRSISVNPARARLKTLQEILENSKFNISELDVAKNISQALAIIDPSHTTHFDKFHDLLNQCLAVWKSNSGGRQLLSDIRYAAARLDELEYGPLIPDD
jgi:hypothetical protein